MSKVIFSKNLNNFLNEFEVDHEEFQVLLGVSYDRMSHWLRGAVYPKMEVMVQICDFFNFPDIYRLITEEISIKEIKKHAKSRIVKTDRHEAA